ncbi:Imm48 family immunity protein [Solibacillus sp. FSL R7-0682]
MEGYYIYKDGKNQELSRDFHDIIEVVKAET